MNLTPANRRNLDKLATYLETLPKRYKHFNMGYFLEAQSIIDDSETRHRNYVDYAKNNGGVNKHYCGAVACAIGHGPSAGVLVPKRYLNNNTSINWTDYSDEFFAPYYSSTWDWMFSGNWEDVDNTHRGAAARIRYILAGNEVPEDFNDEPYLKHKKLYAHLKVN